MVGGIGRGHARRACRPRPLPDVAHVVPGDRRFAAREWHELPYFALMKQGYLLVGEYLNELATLAPLPEPDKHRLAFLTRQYVDALAPTNFMATNPEALKRALSTDGASLVRGLANLVADAQQRPHLDERRARVRGRPQPRGDARQRRLPQRADRADPVRADDRARPPAAAADRAAVHQQVLHPRSAARELLRPLGRRAGPHGVHDLVAQHPARTRRSSTWDDYIEQGVLAADRRSRARSPAARPSMRSASASAARCSRARSRCSPRAATAPSRALTLLTTMLDFADPGDIGVYVSREMLAAREPALHGGTAHAAAASSPARSRACAPTTSSGTTSSATISRARRRRPSTCSTGTATRRTCRDRCTRTTCATCTSTTGCASPAR